MLSTESGIYLMLNKRLYLSTWQILGYLFSANCCKAFYTLLASGLTHFKTFIFHIAVVMYFSKYKLNQVVSLLKPLDFLHSIFLNHIQNSSEDKENSPLLLCKWDCTLVHPHGEQFGTICQHVNTNAPWFQNSVLEFSIDKYIRNYLGTSLFFTALFVRVEG